MVSLIVDRLLLRDERERWKVVEEKAITLVQTELSSVVSLVEDFLVPPMPVTDPRETRLSRMKEIVGSDHLIDFERFVSSRITDCAPVFREKSRRLGSLQLRYSSRLSPELIGLMIDIEESLESISNFCQGGFSTSIALSFFRELIECLVKAIDDQMITMLQLPEALAI